MSQIGSLIENLDSDNSNLIRALQILQENEGYVSDEGIVEVAKKFSLPVIEVEGVLSFYAQFKREKPGKYQISVCDGTACHIKGASLVKNWIQEYLGMGAQEMTDKQGLFSLETVACLGCCSLAPVITINGKIFGNLTRKSLVKVLKQYKREVVA